MDITHMDRTAYDFLNLLGDVGGVLGILSTIFRLISTPFASFRLKAILSSRLFNLSAENRQLIFGEVKLSDERLKSHNLYESETGEILLDIPPFLSRDYLINYFLLCNKNAKFAKYKEIVDQGFSTFDQNLDLIFLTKRLKMHGITFYQRLTARERKLNSQLANLRPLQPQRTKAISSRNDSWEKIESITFQDIFGYAFMKRFQHHFDL